MSVERPHVDRLAEEGRAAIDLREADRLDALGEWPRPPPERSAGTEVEDRDRAGGLCDIHHAVGDQRRGLDQPWLLDLMDPDRLDPGHITGCDLADRREPVCRIVAGVSQPRARFLRGAHDPVVRDLTQRGRGGRDQDETEQQAYVRHQSPRSPAM